MEAPLPFNFPPDLAERLKPFVLKSEMDNITSILNSLIKEEQDKSQKIQEQLEEIQDVLRVCTSKVPDTMGVSVTFYDDQNEARQGWSGNCSLFASIYQGHRYEALWLKHMAESEAREKARDNSIQNNTN